ncbi:MAG: aldo/keto reductase [Bacteroidota bacterium]
MITIVMPSRRKFIIQSSLATGALLTSSRLIASASDSIVRRAIPSTGEQIPVIGMGSWLTFDVERSVGRRAQMKRVLRAFWDNGGRVVDSSPMYGSSERVIGELADELGLDRLWVATKVWTNGQQNGINQVNDSNRYFDSMINLHQVHNLRDFEVHYETLKELKEKGKLKYIGITHYLNSEHNHLLETLSSYELDFVQVNYNIQNPAAESRLLPYAQDNGIAVIINRPFQTGRLTQCVEHNTLPSWSEELGIQSWAQYMLKYIISHPAVTCVIPATTQVPHVIENLEAGKGALPDMAQRKEMLDYYRSL